MQGEEKKKVVLHRVSSKGERDTLGVWDGVCDEVAVWDGVCDEVAVADCDGEAPWLKVEVAETVAVLEGDIEEVAVPVLVVVAVWL